jgi:hypothetical protein
MSIHAEEHPLAGQTVTLASGTFAGESYRIEDWWDRIAGRSWMYCDGNPACLEYAIRSGAEGDLISNEVVYGKIGMFGKLIHVRHFPQGETAHG